MLYVSDGVGVGEAKTLQMRYCKTDQKRLLLNSRNEICSLSCWETMQVLNSF